MEFYEIPRYLKQHGNFPFWHSMIIESLKIVHPDKYSSALDFGSGDGGFLRLYDYLVPGKKLLGVEKDRRLLRACRESNAATNISFDSICNVENVHEKFGMAYSQEVLYTLPELDVHAREVFSLLNEGGYYFATIGCHTENPTYAKRKELIRATESYPALDYSLDDIGKAFYQAGFRVSVKRLPITCPLTCTFEEDSEFGSISDLLLSSEQYKVLFVFMKPKYPR